MFPLCFRQETKGGLGKYRIQLQQEQNKDFRMEMDKKTPPLVQELETGKEASRCTMSSTVVSQLKQAFKYATT